MLQSAEDVYVAALASAALMIFLSAVVGFAIYKYQQRMQFHLREISAMKAAYESELLRSQLEMQEQTMQTVGREIHDNVGQVLSLVKINLGTLPPNDDPKTTEKLTHTKEYLNRAITDLRNLSRSLNVDNRLAAGLAAALRAEVNGIRQTGVVDVVFDQSGPEQRLDARQELLLFRIMQELLNNALKHAKAKKLRFALDYSMATLTLSVADDGVGFDWVNVNSQNIKTQDGERGSGLINMQNRARLIGADLAIQSVAGQGTTAVLILPLVQPPN